MLDDQNPNSQTPDAPSLAPATPSAKKSKARAALGELTQQEAALQAIVAHAVKLKLDEIFPDELPLALLKTHMADVKAARKADAKALTTRKGKREVWVLAESSGEVMARSLERLVNGRFRPGRPERVDFFPPGPGPHELTVRLDAFHAGFEAHPGNPKSIPPALTLANIAAKRQAVADASAARATAVAGKEGTRTSKAPMNALTVQYLRDAIEFLRGYYGESAPELTGFGVRPYRARA